MRQIVGRSEGKIVYEKPGWRPIPSGIRQKLSGVYGPNFVISSRTGKIAYLKEGKVLSEPFKKRSPLGFMEWQRLGPEMAPYAPWWSEIKPATRKTIKPGLGGVYISTMPKPLPLEKRIARPIGIKAQKVKKVGKERAPRKYSESQIINLVLGRFGKGGMERGIEKARMRAKPGGISRMRELKAALKEIKKELR